MKNKLLKYILLTIFILAVIILYLAIKNNIFESTKINYDYKITYKEDIYKYKIYINNNTYTVVSNYYQPICIKEPCDSIKKKNKEKINFSSENLKVVNELVENLFKDNKSKKIKISKEDLTDKEYVILQSIIQNNEKLLDREFNNNIYTIITDMKFTTMMNDGGSHTNIYYEFNTEDNTITKYQDKYVGFEGYIALGEIQYSINIDNIEMKEYTDIFDELLNNKDIVDTAKYNTPYTIKKGIISQSIHNSTSINKLEELLQLIDNNKND